MRKMTPIDRILLLAMCLLAAYQVVTGVDGMSNAAVISYSVGFGVLLVAGLLMIILGFEALESSIVVIISTIIPLSLSLGLVVQFLPALRVTYLVFALGGLVAVSITRFFTTRRLAVLALTLAHGLSGLIIVGLPLAVSLSGEAHPGFALVALGGVLMGAAGLLLSFLGAAPSLITGRPFLSNPKQATREKILSLLPPLLLLIAATFTVGFLFNL